ncbi:MAG: hypothetical protein U0003_00330 [Vampirovibrionales bacterium]
MRVSSPHIYIDVTTLEEGLWLNQQLKEIGYSNLYNESRDTLIKTEGLKKR